MLLKSIAEVAGEPLTVDTADPMAEDRTSTWRPSADPRERVTLTAGQVCAAFERTADALD